MIRSKNSSSFSLDWIKQIPSSIVIIDTDFKLISASPRWEANFQLNLDQVEGKHFVDLFPELAQELKTRLKYSLDGLRDIKFKYNANDCQYSSEDSIWHLNPWKDGYGNIIGVIIKIEPITKTQELELELNKTKLLLNNKASVAKIGSWELDALNNSLLWTPIVNKIHGLPIDFEPTLENAIEFYVDESQKLIQKVVEDAINLGKPWNVKAQLRQKNGNLIWVNTIGRPKFKDGTCTRIIGTIQQVDEDNKIEVKKTILEAELSEYPLFEKVPLGLAIIDFENGNFLNVNQQFIKLSGFEKEYFINKNFKEFIGKSFLNKETDLVTQLKEKESFEPVKFTFSNKSNHSLNLKVTGSLVKGLNNKKSILCTIENITTQTKLEKKLKNTISASREKNDQLLNFAHMVSHNLKTHATNFSLLLNFLNDEKGLSQRNKYMTMLFNASDNLSETIKGLREIVAVKSNLNNEKKLLPLNESVFIVEQNVAGLLKQNNGKIINEISDDIKVKALPAYLNSILTNCITNSIKYKSDDKAPIIILSTEENKNYTILCIEDNGLGIDLEKYGDQLFGLYKTFHRNKESRGIGLYITKNQMDAMNGKITVDSSPGHGTTFKFYFNKK
ncbi:PAS domain S-box protein [Maribacter forsetii]|uniref:PAS domain S-box protein n=1 Tax=Maribacter forsetii TaxID=444515 RepID=UPI000689DD7D|nr:PAS domain S-box protein [Maribacter forsetii]